MKIDSYSKDDVLVIKPYAKRIDANYAVEFKSKLHDLLQNGELKVVINLTMVDFIDSSGLGALVSILKKLETDGTVKLCEVKRGVKSIFALTRLDRFFEILHSEQEAIESFKDQH